ETERRANDQRRNMLFDAIKDVMIVLLEYDDTRLTPDGKPILGRLAQICMDMREDMKECYNVLNAQEKTSIAIKFLKASSWSKELASQANRFTKRREELLFTLSMHTVITTEEINNKCAFPPPNVHNIYLPMVEMFTAMMTTQERDMGRWIQQNGGEAKVLESDEMCADMIKYEATLVASSGAAPFAPNPMSYEDVTKKEVKATRIATLRKEYSEDIQNVIKSNLDNHSKRFEMGLDDLSKDLGQKIQHEGDRLIKYLKGGPHSRIKDRGWKGSAKTRQLALAIRDYFVERVEHSKQYPPLKDAMRLRYVQRQSLHRCSFSLLTFLLEAFDPDASAFTTISEINAFTDGRPADWSFPRWVAYWAIGWQIFAIKYCVEIQHLFAQMFLLEQKIGIVMPGNKRYVVNYIEGTWQYVTALTSGIRPAQTPLWLEEKFSDYVKEQEILFKERLEKIQYDIDAPETVVLILRGARIEEVCPD
ncbi:hypothetical protein K438DRAFT_1590447, partial [Mycena galopus ATCC 62051]